MVWSNHRLVGTVPCGDPPTEYPQYQADILFSIWDGQSWSEAAVAVAGAPDTVLADPGVALDASGNGLVIYMKVVTARSSDCSAASTISVEYAKFSAADRTFLGGGVLEGPYGTEAIPGLPAGPEIAFTARRATKADAFAGAQAVAAWWSLGPTHSKICPSPGGPPFAIEIPTFWPKKAIWNGDSFEQVGLVPDPPPPPPPDLSEISGVTPAKKLGVSSDQYGGATIVWGAMRSIGDPCVATSLETDVWSATWEGDDWSAKAKTFQTLSVPVGGADIAYLASNDAIAVYDEGGGSVRWSLAPKDSAWINKDAFASGSAGLPTIASLAHGETIAIWSSLVDGVPTIQWSRLVQQNPGSSSYAWSPAGQLAQGEGFADIAAHTGSPTQDLARWMMMAYQAGDQVGARSLAPYISHAGATARRAADEAVLRAPNRTPLPLREGVGGG